MNEWVDKVTNPPLVHLGLELHRAPAAGEVSFEDPEVSGGCLPIVQDGTRGAASRQGRLVIYPLS